MVPYYGTIFPGAYGGYAPTRPNPYALPPVFGGYPNPYQLSFGPYPFALYPGMGAGMTYNVFPPPPQLPLTSNCGCDRSCGMRG